MVGMDTTITRLFDERRHSLRARISLLIAEQRSSTTYDVICETVATTILGPGATVDVYDMTPEEYQGEMVAVFHTPDGRSWVSNISYGSCEVCDALQDALWEYEGAERVAAVFGVAVNIVQAMKPNDAHV